MTASHSQDFRPTPNNHYRITKPSAFAIEEGAGAIEVDFKHHTKWVDKIIFLDTDQYIKFPNDSFRVKKIEFEDTEVANHPEYRVLFKHIVNLGTIDYCLAPGWVHHTNAQLLDFSAFEWATQNPFKINVSERNLLFDTKVMIDNAYRDGFKTVLGDDEVEDLLKVKVGHSFKELVRRNRLLRCQRDLAFSTKSVKEIAYDQGFHDPAHFNKFFKQREKKTPQQFREIIAYPSAAQFLQDLQELIIKYHHLRRDAQFYAEKLKVSKRVLQNKVGAHANLTFYQLVKQELLISAKSYLHQGMRVKDIAEKLRFKEPNHFTAFFKSETGHSPTQFLNRYNNYP